ncbi:MAG: 16S rRNA (uracil(1498)-N(3))-methyltransferase [Pseudomonadota bacterium]
MRRLFVHSPICVGQPLTLPSDTSHYVSRVLRSQVDDEFEVFNGDGSAYLSRITHLSKRDVTLDIHTQSSQQPQPSLRIHLGVALSKGDRLDTIVQKCTELGATDITPLITKHVAFKLNDTQREKKHAHWHKIMLSACEQCQQNHVPTIHPITPLDQWANEQQADTALYLHPYAEQSVHQLAQRSITQLSLLIGPEGGLSEADVRIADTAQFEGVTLGPRILRTETAPIAMTAIAQFLWGDV